MMRMRCRLRRLVTIGTVVAGLFLCYLILNALTGYRLGGRFSSQWDGEYHDPIDDNFLSIFRRLPSTGETLTPVVVVEEHYEVLKYWFTAAEKAILPQKGNVLLHIDGHPDGAAPLMIDIIPLFRWPLGSKEIHSMMQRNDEFIVGAALTGFIRRYIWVWPPWISENHEEDEDHQVYNVQIGFLERLVKGGRQLELCYCAQSQHDNSINECRMRNSLEPEITNGPIIEKSDCHLNISGVVEIVSEGKATELLQNLDWITSQDNLILDIDEDYYGCESPVLALYDVGISQATLDGISKQVGQLFCARNVHHEKAADLFFKAACSVIHNLKSSCLGSNMTSSSLDCLTHTQLQSVVLQMIPDFLNSIYDQHVDDMLCNRDNSLLNSILIQGLLRFLLNLEPPQLKELVDVGVCLYLSPKNYFFDERESIHVCHGTNIPNQTAVLFHTPTPREVHERTRNLQALLRSKSLSPDMVTVCRSVRDGYTPRKYFHHIELDIMTTLHSTFPTIHYASTHYDKDLLGGLSGWPKRH